MPKFKTFCVHYEWSFPQQVPVPVWQGVPILSPLVDALTKRYGAGRLVHLGEDELRWETDEPRGPDGKVLGPRHEC